MENNQSSVSERVWGAAEQAGAERKARFEQTMNRLFGLPEAAGKLVEIGSDAAKAKAEELKGKAIDLKERTELKITETKDKLVERYETTRDNLISRVEAFKNKVIGKATELKNRTIKAGIETGAKIEDKVVAICEIPADIKEAKAGKFAEKAVGVEKTKEETVAQQFAELNGLNGKQLEALKALLERQAGQKEMLEKEHVDVRAEMDKSIEAAKEKSLELKDEAIKIRDKVEKRRFFKKLLERIK